MLITGGYLIINPKFHGLVFTTSARFHTTVHPIETPQNSDFTLICESPQFSKRLELSSQPPGDDYISKCVRTYFALKPCLLSGTHYFKFEGDNEYYSFRDQLKVYTPEAIKGLEKFSVPSSSGKTGLGSSAGLIASFITAMYCWFH